MTCSAPTVAATLADYAVGQQLTVLDEGVARHARRALIDWCAAVLAGSRLSPTVELTNVLGEDIGHGRSMLFNGTPATTRAAALWNGVASHAAEVDDVYRDAVYHPGSPVIAAALAVTIAEGGDTEQLYRAIVAGYETSIRIALAVFDAHYAYWHPTGTVGALGAAIAASCVMRLDRSRTADAISLAVTSAAGLQQAFRSESMAKPMHAGRAAETGVLAALAAQAGITGARDTIEGKSGFGAAMGGSPDWAAAIADLGERSAISEMTFKNHCCCGQAFAAIDAALALRERHGVRSADIEDVEIVTYATAVEVAGGYSVDGPLEARFSIPYLVAHALECGSVRLDATEAPARRNPVVLSLMKRTRIGVDPSFSEAFPSKRYARVTLTTRNGRNLSHQVSTRKGDPDCPLSDAELHDKFVELAVPVIGDGPTRKLLHVLRSGDKLASNSLPEIVREGWRA